MKKFMICAIALFLLLSTSVFGDTPPGNVQSTFKKMYPKANGVAWSQDDGYYCANFAMNGFTKNVWFNVRGQWVMTQTDLVSLDRLTPTVYNAFVSGHKGYCSKRATLVICMIFSGQVPFWKTRN